MRGTDRPDTLSRTLPNSTMPHRCDCWNSRAMVCVSSRPLWICRFSTIVLSCTVAKCKKVLTRKSEICKPRPHTASDKLTLTLTGSRADRQDTSKNSTYLSCCCVPNIIQIGYTIAEILKFEILRKHWNTHTQLPVSTQLLSTKWHWPWPLILTSDIK